MLCEADDAALLVQGKEDNEAERKIDRKDVSVLEWFNYKWVHIHKMFWKRRLYYR